MRSNELDDGVEEMRLAAILLFIIASLVDDDEDAPEAMTGDDYPNASEATELSQCKTMASPLRPLGFQSFVSPPPA